MSPRKEREPASLGDLIPRFFTNAGLEGKMDLSRLVNAWTEAVGPLIASHSVPVGLSDGVLTVRADSAVWASELRLLGARVATAASAFLGGATVTEVRVQVGHERPGSHRRDAPDERPR